MAEAAVEPVVEPVAEAAPPPVAEPIVEPAVEPAAEVEPAPAEFAWPDNWRTFDCGRLYLRRLGF